MEFRTIENLEQVRVVFPIMKQLREHLDEKNFLKLFQLAKEQSGYTLIAAYDNDNCMGLMGFRILTDFVHGRHLYIDDLVTTEACRSKGVGSKFLQRAKEIAEDTGCKRMRLCTGIQNERGKSFYERNGWDLKAVVYKAKL